MSIPPDIVALEDYARHAAELISPGLRGFFFGAGADGLTAAANHAAWAGIRLRGRVLADLRGATTACTLLGEQLAHPLILAPVAFHGLLHPEGEHATALGAAATDSLMTVSCTAGLPLEAIAAEAQGPLWFQLYMQAERRDTLHLLRRAETAGYRALVVTVDAAVNGLRNAEQRAGFALPPGYGAVNLAGYAQPSVQSLPGRGPVFLGLMDAAPRWEDLRWLRDQTRLPLLLKGVIDPEDAAQALAVGVDGLIVSNHGGRTLDTLPASADALPLVAAAVAGRVPVLVDGGIRRGTDVLKALALGASAVLIGRPQIEALAVGGPAGVAHMLSILRAELEVAMALTGVADLADVGAGVLWPPRT